MLGTFCVSESSFCVVMIMYVHWQCKRARVIGLKTFSLKSVPGSLLNECDT